MLLTLVSLSSSIKFWVWSLWQTETMLPLFVSIRIATHLSYNVFNFSVIILSYFTFSFNMFSLFPVASLVERWLFSFSVVDTTACFQFKEKRRCCDTVFITLILYTKMFITLRRFLSFFKIISSTLDISTLDLRRKSCATSG